MGLSGVSAVLWMVAVVAIVWVLAPTIAFALGIGGVRTEVLRDVGPPSISGDQVVFEERLRQLAALGFRDAGRARETGIFMLPGHWRWRQFETTHWLVGPDGRTHATLHRLIRDEPARISFITVFDDGGVVRTTCPGTGRMPSLPNYRVTEIRGVDASQLLAAHEQQVAAFAREGRINGRAATLAEVVAANDAAEHPLMRQIGDGMHGIVLPFAPFVGLFIAGGYLSGILGSAVVPFGICVAAVGHALHSWMVRGPMRHVVTRHSHIGDALRDLAPEGPASAGPAPAGPTVVAPDGTTAAMRKDRRALRGVAMVSAVLAVPGPMFFAAHPRNPVGAAVALMGVQLFVTYLTATAALGVLRRARGAAAVSEANRRT
jgi:hypothetical protein